MTDACFDFGSFMKKDPGRARDLILELAESVRWYSTGFYKDGAPYHLPILRACEAALAGGRGAQGRLVRLARAIQIAGDGLYSWMDSPDPIATAEQVLACNDAYAIRNPQFRAHWQKIADPGQQAWRDRHIRRYRRAVALVEKHQAAVNQAELAAWVAELAAWDADGSREAFGNS
jgi:hypothetical protein